MQKQVCLDTSILISLLESDWRSPITALRLDEISRNPTYVIVSADVVQYELGYNPRFAARLKPIYERYVRRTYPSHASAINVSKEYMREVFERTDVKLPRADAALLALSSLNSLDVLLTWNFEHLDNAQVISIIKELNSKKKLSTPFVTNPKDFIP